MTVPPRLAAAWARVGWSGVLGILLALSLANTYADVSLKGPLGIGIHFEGWKPKAQRLQRTIDNFDQAQDDALAAAELAKAKAEADYRNLAERIDDEAEEARTGALADAERFIAANRVRCAPDRGAAGRAVAPAPDQGARDREALPGQVELAEAVAVPEGDIRACTLNTLQADAARTWALDLEAASRSDE